MIAVGLDQSHFSKAFRCVTGATPKDWQRRLSTEEASDWGWTAAVHTEDRDRLIDF